MITSLISIFAWSWDSDLSEACPTSSQPIHIVCDDSVLMFYCSQNDEQLHQTWPQSLAFPWLVLSFPHSTLAIYSVFWKKIRSASVTLYANKCQKIKFTIAKNENSRNLSHPRRTIIKNWVNDLWNGVVRKLEKLQSLIQAIFYQTNEKWFEKKYSTQMIINHSFRKYTPGIIIIQSGEGYTQLRNVSLKEFWEESESRAKSSDLSLL